MDRILIIVLSSMLGGFVQAVTGFGGAVIIMIFLPFIFSVFGQGKSLSVFGNECILCRTGRSLRRSIWNQRASGKPVLSGCNKDEGGILGNAECLFFHYSGF